MFTMTRRMASVLDELEDEFKSIYTTDQWEYCLYALSQAKSDRPSKLRRLYDMLDESGIAYARGRDNGYYEDLVHNWCANQDPDYTTDRMLLALYRKFEQHLNANAASTEQRYRAFMTPAEYMRSIVNRLCNPDDGWQKDSLRLRILKQFIKYGNYLRGTGIQGKVVIEEAVTQSSGKSNPTMDDVLAAIDDSIFDRLNRSDNYDSLTKDQRREERRKVELIRMANDLANGLFRTQGSTRQALYMFAMVYGMTFHTQAAGANRYDDRDVEQLLFRGYYMNNLMRFLTEDYQQNVGEYDPDPSGQGINYKNFAEVIYLYYLSRDQSPKGKRYTPADRIRLSSQMIKRVKVIDKNPDASADGAFVGGTAYYRTYIDEVLEQDEDHLAEYLGRYDRNTAVKRSRAGDDSTDEDASGYVTVNQMEVQTEQNTAYQVYEAVLDHLQSEYDAASYPIPVREAVAQARLRSVDVSLENCNYGLWFTDVGAFRKKGCATILKQSPDADPASVDLFMNLLLRINQFMGKTVYEETSSVSAAQEHKQISTERTNAMYVPNARAITRTSLVVAYYYYYNALNVERNISSTNLQEVFDDIKEGIDPLLEAAYYQPFSGSNLFDVIVAFSSYAYIMAG